MRITDLLDKRSISLDAAPKTKDCFIKIETRGSGGAKNVLTDQEIREADCIIVAADAKVPMDRFDGKKVIECQVSDGISKADQLVERAISGDVPVYHAAAGSQSVSCFRSWPDLLQWPSVTDRHLQLDLWAV